MVKVMDALIESGYIEKKVNPQDRREHFVFLTKKGKRQTEKIVTAFAWIDLEIFKSVSFEEQENFNKVLFKIETNLKRLPANDLYFNYKKSSKINGKKKEMSAASITQ
jgi:DNA-binding MarR family transcriptional regulator